MSKEMERPPPYNPNPGNPPYPVYPVLQPQPNMPQQQPIHVTVHQQPQPTQTVIVTPGIRTGNCPGCRVGVLRHNFTCCGICCAIIFFPIGILCCILMTEKQCSHCGGTF